MRKRLCMLLILTGLFVSLDAQESGARWSLESDRAVVGQALTLTLEVQGDDRIDPPVLAVPGVDITFQGGGPRNSTSIVSVNGKTTRTVTKAWVGSWTLKCTAVGSYRLEGRELSVGGKTVLLPALDWQVGEALHDDRFELRQSLSQNACVPGIELEYTLVWYIAQSVQSAEFTLPILDSADLVPVESSFAGVTGDTFQVQYKGRLLTGVKSTARLGSRDYTTLTIRFKIKPGKPGRYDLSETMVSFSGAVDSRRTRDFFGNIIDEPVYMTLAAKAQPLVLEVKDLPAKGKPDPFSGLIGKLKLSWEGGQGAYSVGEPIRLALLLSGVQNKPNLDLDYMVITALGGNDFQVSSDLSAKEEEGKRSYVLRARRPGKLTVPALSLNYFDPVTERYGSTVTKPLVFEIGGSAPGTPGVGAKASPAGQADASEYAEGGPDTTGGDTLARMNPNGLKRSFWPSLPWWTFGLPGVGAGFAFLPAALWRHSKRRIRSVQRKAWRKTLSSLASPPGRDALEEGRLKIRELLSVSGLWKERLVSLGHWEYLMGQLRDWDEAYFDDGRDEEDWKSRWDAMRKTMESWK